MRVRSGMGKLFSPLVLAFCAVLFGLISVQPVQAAQLPSRYGAIVLDYDSGEMVYGVNPDRRSYPASLTKVMTLFLLFDALEQGRFTLNSQLPVSSHAEDQAPSKLGLQPGQTISVQDAILALVTKSANDVAVVIAEAIAGDEDDFAALMTRKARAIGMNSTTYQNASGLPDPNQVSTPRDQAILGRAIIRAHGKYYHYFSTRQFRWKGAVIPTHNRFMLRYPGADGMKTGYINASGFNLVASAKRDGQRLVGVVFGGDTGAWRDRNMMQIMDKGFARLRKGGALVEAEDRPDLDNLIAQANKPAKPAKAAAAKAKAKPTPDAEDEDEDEDWTVQVGGNFSQSKQAHQAASAAAKRLGGLVSKANIKVAKVKQGKHVAFKARLTGFSEDEAHLACKRLTRARKDCKILAP